MFLYIQQEADVSEKVENTIQLQSNEAYTPTCMNTIHTSPNTAYGQVQCNIQLQSNEAYTPTCMNTIHTSPNSAYQQQFDVQLQPNEAYTPTCMNTIHTSPNTAYEQVDLWEYLWNVTLYEHNVSIFVCG